MADRRPPLLLPKGLPATDTGEERKLLQRLERNLNDTEFRDSLYDLGSFYNRVGHNDLALRVMIILLQYCGDREERAFCYMSLGQISEQEAQYALAMQYYSEGLKLGPEAKLVAYYLNNNMGSCLNAEKRYLEGERFCRAAIEIDSGRANAFRNLGISLEGQGDVVGAAWAYAEASGVNSSDVKAQRLLRRLIFANSKTLIPFVNTLLRESTAGTGH